MQHQTLAFIGAGSMASSIIGGLINDGYDAGKIIAANPSSEKLLHLKTQFHIQITENNVEAMEQADVILFCVKPDKIASVSHDLKTVNRHDKLVISVAAGITCELIEQWLLHKTPIIRAMPNTPSLLGAGACGLFANDSCTKSHKDIGESIFRSVGITLWVQNEADMNAITALSGSGPAYFLLVFEAMIDCAVQWGLSYKQARLLVLQTALGATRMAMEHEEPIQQLRQSVTSKGGTTQAAIETLQHHQLPQIFQEALENARNRASEMTELFAKEHYKALEKKS